METADPEGNGRQSGRVRGTVLGERTSGRPGVGAGAIGHVSKCQGVNVN